jgi:hypothetical protein
MNINQLTSHLTWLLGDRSPHLKKKIAALEVEMLKLCSDSPQAIIPTHDIDLHPRQLDLSDLSWGDDYEVSGTFKVDVDDKELRKFLKVGEYEWTSDNERDDIINDLDDRESECTDRKNRCLKNDNADRAEYWDNLSSALSDLIHDIKKAEIDYDEVMWNTVWRPYNDDPDPEIARRCGLAVVTLLRDEESYLGLCGCGMDLRPLLIAYCVLKYGQVDHENVSYFCKDLNYTVYVMGPDLWHQVTEKLGITKLMRTRLAKERKERAASDQRNERWQKRSEALRARIESQRRVVARKLHAVQRLVADFPGEDLGVMLRVVDHWLTDLILDSVPHAKRFAALLKRYMALQGTTGPLCTWRDVMEDAGIPQTPAPVAEAPVEGSPPDRASTVTPVDPAASTPLDAISPNPQGPPEADLEEEDDDTGPQGGPMSAPPSTNELGIEEDHEDDQDMPGNPADFGDG